MFRRISTKLVLAVLAAVVVPFVGFAVFLDQQMAERTLQLVREALRGMVADLAAEVDHKVADMRRDVGLWSADSRLALAVRERSADPAAWGARQTAALARGEEPGGDSVRLRRDRAAAFDRCARMSEGGLYDLLLLVDADGRLVLCNSTRGDGPPLAPATLEALFERDYSREPWLAGALADGLALVDHHRSPYLPPPDPGDPEQVPSSYHVGMAGVVRDAGGRAVGALYALANWRHFQELVGRPVVKDYFRGLVVEPGGEPSPYAWIWKSDADTIIAHAQPALYGMHVSGPEIDLPRMVEDARSADWGLYREYTFRGVRKNAAFKHCAGPDQGGFGWVVGLGIDNHDIYGAASEVRGILLPGTAVVLILVVLWTMVIARRTTQPIQLLQQHVRRVSEGDLAQRIDIRSDDELGQLARDFNDMTRDLAEQRAQLIKAEKDAAWREMARQIAHDIKNPLTPIKLSLDLLRRARMEGAGNYEQILDRTLDLMERQVANLRDIATEFYEFTGGRAPRPEVFDAGDLLDEVLDLHAAWAAERGVRMRREGTGGEVRLDPGKLRRVLTNLVSNAIEAMSHGGGELVADCRVVDAGGASVRVEIRDTGVGLSEEVRQHLFEPYFTTRTEGTGLGLAVAKRVVEEMGGTIDLAPREAGEGAGTVARLTLPAHASAGERPAAGDARDGPSGSAQAS